MMSLCIKPMLFLILFCSAAFGEIKSSELNQYAYLHKLSNHLRGKNPEPHEYKALQQAIEKGRAEIFLDATINSYLNTPEYRAKLIYKVYELFQINPSNKLPNEIYSRYRDSKINDKGEPIIGYYKHNQYTAFYQLLDQTIKQNLPWTNLITGKDYTAFSTLSEVNRRTVSYNDIQFFGAVAPDAVPASTNGIIRDYLFDNSSAQISDRSEQFTNSDDPATKPTSHQINFDEDDQRIAGLVTTETFFRRYSNSSINKNRKRAAAIFRIFLCDPMTAAIPESKDGDKENFKIVLPDNLTEEEAQLVSELGDTEKLHGTRADCMKCHRKLDPMGKTLLPSGRFLSPYVGLGALAYTGADGREVNIPSKGIGEIAKAISQQPEYSTCQVEHLWKWFIGTDYELTKTRKNELATSFSESGMRINDFVKTLVKSKEFKTRLAPKSEFEQKISEIKSIFKTCTSCHNNSAYIPMDDFTKWPIGGKPQVHKYWVEFMSKELDLAHLNSPEWKPSMPPKWSSWRPSKEQVELIKWWIEQGTPDENGNKLLTE